MLAPEDWQGKWIGGDQGESAVPLDGAKWIWFPEGNPAESAPVYTRYFRRVFELPANEPVSAAPIEITADDQFDLYINGQAAGKADGWGSLKNIAVSAFLKPGENVLAVEARNVGNNPNPSGVLAKLKIAFAQGTPLTLTTGEGWKSATKSETGWIALAFDDTACTKAKLLGECGTQTWGVHAER